MYSIECAMCNGQVATAITLLMDRTAHRVCAIYQVRKRFPYQAKLKLSREQCPLTTSQTCTTLRKPNASAAIRISSIDRVVVVVFELVCLG